MTECAGAFALPPGRQRGGLAAGSSRSYRRGFRQLPELRSELIRRADDARRHRDRGGQAEARLADEANSEWLHAAIDRFGWPGWAAVGTDGSRAAWAITQHGTAALRNRVLPLLAAAVLVADADPVCLAYLIDRVLVTEGRPQLFGTQYESRPGGLVRYQVDHPDRAADRQRHLGIDRPTELPGDSPLTEQPTHPTSTETHHPSSEDPH